MVALELENHILRNYGREFECVMSHTLESKSLISVDSSTLRHMCFFELRSVAFSNLNSFRPVDDSLPDQK